MKKMLKRNSQSERKWREVTCSCGHNHIEAFIAGQKVRFVVKKCECPEGTQHTIMMANERQAHEQYH